MKKITLGNIEDVFNCKMMSRETAELKGYELFDEFFVDSSGFGTESEPALKVENFKKRLESIFRHNPDKTFYACLTGIGQFQVYVGLFTKTGKKRSKRVASNTLEITNDDGTRAIRLYETDILTFSPDGKSVQLDSGGHKTKTTKERMIQFLPRGFNIFQKNFEWFIVTPNNAWDNPIAYHDGIIIKIS